MKIFPGTLIALSNSKTSNVGLLLVVSCMGRNSWIISGDNGAIIELGANGLPSMHSFLEAWVKNYGKYELFNA